MGNIASYSSGATAATATSDTTLHGATCIGRIVRILVDDILALTGGQSMGLGQLDDGTDANAKCWVYAQDNGSGTGKSLSFTVGGGAGGITLGAIPNATWGPTGSYIVIYAINSAQAGVGFFNEIAVYDGTGTNTLLDGQPTSTSVFYKRQNYNAPFPSHTGDGICHANYAQGKTSRVAHVDAEAWITTPRTAGTEDSEPTSADPSAWLYDDTIGSTSFANLNGSGFPLVASGTVTLVPGGAWGPTASTPTTVTVTPSSLSLSVGVGGSGPGTATLGTDDQNGNPMSSRTYGQVSNSNTGVATSSITGSTATITPVGVGTCAIVYEDNTGGPDSGATHATLSVTVSSAGVTFDWVNSNGTDLSVGSGAATEIATELAAGTGTITVTRHGTSATCSIAWVCSVTSSGGGGGGTNEPSGMFVGLNTGDLLVPPVTPAQVAAGQTTWQVGSNPVSTFQQSAPAVKDSSGDWAGNLILCPDAPGYRIIYDTTLQGAASPTRPGVPIVLPTSPTGTYYVASHYRIGGANASWNFVGSQGAAPAGIKLFAIHDRNGNNVAGTGTNHVYTTAWDFARTGNPATPDVMFVMFLQGPNNQSQAWPTNAESAYNPANTYAIGHVAIGSDGNHYTAIASVPASTPPPNATYWRQMLKHYSNYYNAFAYLNGAPPTIPVDGAFHLLELLTQGESTPGAGDGHIDLWIDGTHEFHVEGVQFLAPGDLPGFSFAQWDPTWGGEPNPADGPAQTQYVDFNRLYVSQK